MFLPRSLVKIQYCVEPLWPRGSVLGLKPAGFEFQILCLEGSVISFISFIFRWFSWPSLIYMCTQVAQNTIQLLILLWIINDLPNKSRTGFDDISMRIIKAIKTEIIPALTCIFNQSLNTGIFPEKLKIDKVIPIHKKGSIRYIKLPSNLTPSLNI